MTDAAPLLSAKLLPPTTDRFHLPRPRLHDRLRTGLSGRVTLLAAGPGYGKSSLVARCLRELGGEWVWYRIDASDQDPWTLFRYLTHGLRELVPEFGERSGGMWESLRGQTGQAERLADAFIQDAEECLGGQIQLVLDGIHCFDEGSPCAHALRRLVAYLPGTLHLLLLGRSAPGLGIKALMADDSVNLVHGEELLFTLDETQSLLKETFGLRVTSGIVERIQARTRGWVTALQLLRQTARLRAGAPEPPEEIFEKTEHEIFDYFSEEVLAAETGSARSFLLDSSLPLTIDPDVCAEAIPSEDVPAVLGDLVKRSLFISPLDSRGEHYVYDPLFHEFLRRKVRTERGTQGVRDLHRRYAQTFLRKGEVAQALSHGIAAEDVKQIEQVLSRHGKPLLRAGMLDVVRDAALFAAGRGARSASVQDLLGETSRLAGDHTAAVGHFERALAKPPRGARPLAGGARASTLQGLAYSLLKVGEVDRAAGTAREAIETLDQSGSDDSSLRSRILNTLSIIQYREERHEEALAGWQEALRCARLAADEHLTRMIAHNIGLPHAVLGDFARASECFNILTRPDNTRLGPEEGAAYLNLGRIETLRGQWHGAASLLGDAREIARRWHLKGLEADVLEAEGTLLRETGDVAGAQERYAQARALFTELGQPDLLDGLAEEEAILAARRADYGPAVRSAEGVAERHRASGDRVGLGSALLALGEVRLLAGDLRGATAALAEACAIFESLRRSYQRCLAGILLAVAWHGLQDRARAADAARTAVELASLHDYRFAVLRAARLDEAFGRFLSSLPTCPPWIRDGLEQPASPASQPGAVPLSRADLTVRLLGPVEVYRDAQRKIPSQAWKIRRALQLFCFLASSRDRRATRDRIADALWGEARPSVIEKNFHPTVSFLRRALNHGHAVPKNFIILERGAYRLNPAYAYEIDTQVFEEKILSARRSASAGALAEALSKYEAALALYRGPFLEEEYDAWAEAPRTHFERLHVAALGEAAELHFKANAVEPALACLRKLVAHDPLDEGASSRLMKALGRLSNRAGVMKEFERLSQALEQELSAEPLPETRRAYREALETSATEPTGVAERRRKP